MSGTATFENTGVTFTQPDKAWLASVGVNPDRTANHTYNTEAGYNVSNPKANGVTPQELANQLNSTKAQAAQQAPKVTDTARQATETLRTSQDTAAKSTASSHAATQAARANTPSTGRGGR